MILGLTGGMGCGKSTVARFFSELGYERLDSDEIIRNQVLTHPEVIDQLRGHFGPSVLSPGGSIDRARLAAIIFADPIELQWVETVLHPRLFSFWRTCFEHQRDRRWIVEVPLLFEKHLENWFDFIVCVTTTSDQQLARLEKRGITRVQAAARISKQLPLSRKSDLSDYVIGNDGALWFLREQVMHLVQKLEMLSEGENAAIAPRRPQSLQVQ